MRSLLIFAACLFATPAFAQLRPHLCKSGEEAIFACAIGTKIVSLCASNELNESSGYLQYRFGTKKRIELAHPIDVAINPRNSFYWGVTGTSGGGADFVRFSSGATTYTVYSDYYRGRESDGIVVERDGRRISVLRCDSPAIDGRKGWSTLYRANLPKAAPDFEVP